MVARVMSFLPLIAFAATARGQAWDNVTDFSGTNNPTGAWSYGWSPSRATTISDFHIFTQTGTGAEPALMFWSRPQGTPSMGDNTGDHTIRYADNPSCPPQVQLMHPGSSGENCVLRWTAPVAGTFRIDADVGSVPLDPDGCTTDTAVLVNGEQLWSAYVDASGHQTTIIRALAVNDIVDLTIGFGDNGTYLNDSTSVHLTITTLCPADFNGDGFADFFDFNDFVTCFEGGDCPTGRDADFNGDGFVDFFDFNDFVSAFESGC